MVCKNIGMVVMIGLLFTVLFVIFASENSRASLADDLVDAILDDNSTLVKNSERYDDNDNPGHRQAKVCTSSMGILNVTRGTSSYILMSTGIAGSIPATSDEDGNGEPDEPGDERGTYFKDRYGHPRDFASLEMKLDVPSNMYYIEYYIRFLSVEYPEYVNTKYNDEVTITVISPSHGTTQHSLNVNTGRFEVMASDMPGTGFDVFAVSGDPDMVDIVTRTPNAGGDAGATYSTLYQHPVSPGERITVIFEITDAGDNLLDSTVFIDGLAFDSGDATPIITAEKSLEDLDGGRLLFNDTIQYTIKINNLGSLGQGNNTGHEFEDFIPDNTAYVDGSAYATSGTIDYDAIEHKITWNGSILSLSNVTLTFNVTVNSSLESGTIISNQGIAYWDSNGNGTNDATEYTDDTSIDDGIDQDGDGYTDDDDSTDIIVRTLIIEKELNEDFSDDSEGGRATEIDLGSGETWFETSDGTAIGCDFEVASDYHYSTANSFKTQLRATGGSFYWYYYLSELFNLSSYSDVEWWEIWFKCEDSAEASNLSFELENNDSEVIAKIKFEYVQNGSSPPMDWIIKLKCWNLNDEQLEILYDDHLSGWYRLRIGISGSSNISYSLYDTDDVQVGLKVYEQADPLFSGLSCVKWYSTMNPIVCPMFFWDEHILYLS